MAFINQGTKEIQIKIVYYGPAKGGKTSNLEYLHEKVQTAAPESKSQLMSLATSSDRTLFFDFYPMETPAINGFKTKFSLFTVPGQVIYNNARRVVLTGVDGIVFVADSQWGKMHENIESFENLAANLAAMHLDLKTVPYVLQYNKRDMGDVAPSNYMDYLLNYRDEEVPSIGASATEGDGVFETLDMISRLLVQKFVLGRKLLV